MAVINANKKLTKAYDTAESSEGELRFYSDH